MAQKVPTRLVPASGWGPRYDPSYQAQHPPPTQSELAAKAVVITPTPPPLPGSRAQTSAGPGPSWLVCVGGPTEPGQGHGRGRLPLWTTPPSAPGPSCPSRRAALPPGVRGRWHQTPPHSRKGPGGRTTPQIRGTGLAHLPPPPAPSPLGASVVQYTDHPSHSGCRPRPPAPSLLKASPLGCPLAHLSAPVHSPALGIPSSPDPLFPSGHWAPQQQPWSMEGPPALTPVPTDLPSHPISGP